MRFDILTIFPSMFDSYTNESILKRAQKKKLIKIQAHNIRDYAVCEEHRKARPPRKPEFCGRCGRVDDRPFGGGAGMVMAFPPIASAVAAIKSKVKSRKSIKTRTILFSTRGKKFDAKTARRLARYDQLILICGRYEGVDERVAQVIADEEISIGDFVLTGGELPAMIVIDAVSRQISGVLGKVASLEEKQGSYPTYTRPEAIYYAPHATRATKNVKRGANGVKHKTRLLRVPRVLLSGNHKMIQNWRQKQGG